MGETCSVCEPPQVLWQTQICSWWSARRSSLRRSWNTELSTTCLHLAGKNSSSERRKKRLLSLWRRRWPRSAPDSQASSVYGSADLRPCRLHAFWEWLFADGDMLLHPPCPHQPGGQTAADRQGRPRPLKWCSPGEIIGEQRGHVWWKHTLQIYLRAGMSERQQCHSQTLYLELSFFSLPLLSAEAWNAGAEQIPPALIMTALRKSSTTLDGDIIQSTLNSIWSVLLHTQHKYNVSLIFLHFSTVTMWPWWVEFVFSITCSPVWVHTVSNTTYNLL